ncbi:ribonuclease P protein component [Phaeobacter sp. B1627]|uniref:ribonuclease P protein component n=1 Tax=Phaeobacter sp. B1627 TaxID=2583809 RepID=UPI0011181371|nr:ribonuclease P protein component [Phaeobacter sp. B1627]TNJ40713.1 ribonuclease P protein component [Phaeobacter sp. B1627]
MKPPEAPMDGTADQGTTPPAVSVCAPHMPMSKSPPPSPKPPKVRAGMEVMTKRRDFVAAARARKQGTQSMMVQGRQRGDDAPLRVGYTCSKKVGNAVTRNRAKRRLREIARLLLQEHGRPGWDYVLIGRAGETTTRPFSQMQKDFLYALRRIHGG